MKCICCGESFGDNMGACPLCGFPVIATVGGAEIPEAQLEEQLRAFRANRLSGKNVFSHIYYWKKSGDGIALKNRDWVKLADSSELCRLGEKWLDMKFARTLSSDSIELEYRIGDNGDEKTARIEIPKDESFWQLGIRVEEKLCFRFLLRSDGELKESELISLI